jgi:hypothetical protein
MRNGKPMRITPHVLRKANAIWLATRGIHPRMLQSLLRHSAGSRITDQHYVQSTDEALRGAAITLPVWEANTAELAILGNSYGKGPSDLSLSPWYNWWSQPGSNR